MSTSELRNLIQDHNSQLHRIREKLTILSDALFGATPTEIGGAVGREKPMEGEIPQLFENLGYQNAVISEIDGRVSRLTDMLIGEQPRRLPDSESDYQARKRSVVSTRANPRPSMAPYSEDKLASDLATDLGKSL